MGIMISALFPVFAIIILGFLFKTIQFPSSSFWPSAAKIAFYVFIPALLFNKLAHSSLISTNSLPMVLSLLLSIIAISIIIYISKYFVSLSGPSFSSVYQGSTRFNIFIGLALAESFFGQDGLAMAAVAILGLTPLINTLCVIVVTVTCNNDRQGAWHLLYGVVKNPIVLSCLLGLFCNLASVQIPNAINATVDILDQAALPLGLLVVGSGLQLRIRNIEAKGIALSFLFKLIMLPLLCYSFCMLFQVDYYSRDIALLFTALPTATAGYILAQQLGGDIELIAQIITFQVIISFFTLPVIFSLFHTI
jgi:hypothetical protein